VPDRKFPPQRELVSGVPHVGDLDRLQVTHGAAGYRGAVERHRFWAPPEFAERSCMPEHVVIDDGNLDNLGLANVGGVPGYCVKHGLNVTWRFGDYAENVADRRLLL
jgi:hypothetical protein